MKMKASKVLQRIIQIILIGIILFSIYRIGSYYLQRQASNKAYGEISSQVEEIKNKSTTPVLANETENTEDTDENKEKDESEISKANDEGPENEAEEKPNYQEIMAYLQGLNEDIVAYIEVDGTSIAYPIAQGPDNYFYLWRGLDKKDNIQGSLFMDTRNSPDFTDKNTIIYGHLMRRGDMFSPLKNFYDQEFTNTSPKTFELISPQGLISCRIFSIMEIPASDHDDILFGGQNDWTGHLENLRSRSQADFHYTNSFEEADQIISLSTCVENYDDNYRTVVFALVEPYKK